MDNQVCFTTNQYGWILLTPTLGQKVIMRAVGMGKIKRVKEENDHRAHEIIAEGSVKIRSKHYDTSVLIKKLG